MELKPEKLRNRLSAQRLLIVPYGIETKKSPPFQGSIQGLLIVPYGIETKEMSSPDIQKQVF